MFPFFSDELSFTERAKLDRARERERETERQRKTERDRDSDRDRDMPNTWARPHFCRTLLASAGGARSFFPSDTLVQSNESRQMYAEHFVPVVRQAVLLIIDTCTLKLILKAERQKHLIRRPCYQRGSLCQDPAGSRTTRRPPDLHKERQTEGYGHVYRLLGLTETILQVTVKGGRR